MGEVKKVYAYWGRPTLDAECPHCGKSNNYFEQWEELEYPHWFAACEGMSEKKLEGIKWKCPDCKEEFEFSFIEW